MVEIVVTNTHSRIIGPMHSDRSVCDSLHQAIRKKIGYRVQGADWSPAFKEGAWDGIISMYNKRQQSFPTGNLPRVCAVLDEYAIKYKYNHQRIKPDANVNITAAFEENNRELRWYQIAAADAALKYTRGVIAVCTGGGKTLITCEIIHRMKVAPVVVVVPSISLLRQTRSELAKYLKQDDQPANVGAAGGGICEVNPSGVNVITYQTALAAFDERYQATASKKGKANTIVHDPLAGTKSRKSDQELMTAVENAAKLVREATRSARQELTASYTDDVKLEEAIQKKLKKHQSALSKAQADLAHRHELLNNKKRIREVFAECSALIVDEAHIAAVVIQALGDHAPKAYYRFATTATPFRESGDEVRMEAVFGRKLIQISASDLIEMDYLVPPKIFMVPIKHNEPATGYAEIYNKHVTHCWERNWRIKQYAEHFFESGRPTLILVERIEHGELLASMIDGAIFVAGGDTSGDDDEGEIEDDDTRDYRKRKLDECEACKIILIATSWAYTGVDAPAIACLVLAGVAQSTVTTYQQVGRVLRLRGRDLDESIANGKEDAIVVDFYDAQPILRKHSNQRIEVYRHERAFQFQKLKAMSV